MSGANPRTFHRTRRAGGPLLGAHVGVSGGLARGALRAADELGAQAVQVFTANPRGWAPAVGDPLQDQAFRVGCEERGLAAYVHAPYLINLGSPTPATLLRSVQAVRHNLLRGRQIGARGVVVHAGSAVAGAGYEQAMRQVREALLPILDDLAAAPDAPLLLLEPTAGGGQSLASTLAGTAAYLDRLDLHPMLGICLDTCHLHAAGHDLSPRGAMTRTLDEAVRLFGAGRLALVHANDSQAQAGSTRDRHTSIGMGTIGLPAFRALLRHPATRGIGVVLETPDDDDGHARDLATLRSLRRR